MNDAASTDPAEPASARDARLLEALNAQLGAVGTLLEIYYVGGAVMYQAFAAEPPTEQVEAMLKRVRPVEAAIRDVGREHGAPEAWLDETARRILGAGPVGSVGGAYVELSHLHAFVPPAEYVFAVKCAATRLGAEPRGVDDIRYLLRAMNLRSREEALSVVERYLTQQQLPGDLRASLERLLSS